MGDSSHVQHQLVPPTKKSSNKIRDIVRLQQMLKKWKKAAATATKNNNNNNSHDDNAAAAAPNNNKTSSSSSSSKGGLNKFLKKTLSFSDMSSSSQGQGQQEAADHHVVKKGYLAVWVGRCDEEGMKKFVIPTEYLAHQAFSALLRDAEEEFGFQQEGILKIPCDVPLFEKILSTMHSDTKIKRPTLKSSSSTSSFFLYDQQQPQPQPPPDQTLLNHCSSPAPPHNINTPPSPPTHHLPLYCR